MAKKARKLGDGSRAKGRAAQAAQHGARNPAAVAAAAARKEYGKRADTVAAHGRRQAKAEREASAAAGAPPTPPKPKPSRRARV
jgi:hypothetical protein